MSLLNFNDINIQQKNNQEIFQSFSKNEQFVSNQKIKKNNNIFTNDFSFKKQLFPSLVKNNQLNSNNNLLNNENIDISNFNTIQNENDNIYSKDNNILFSGHFNNNINNNNFINNIQIQPFSSIKEENSFINNKNKNNNNNNKLYHKKIFSSLKTKINFNYKSKKHEKNLKSSEDLEIEKINKEKLELKKLKNLNELNNLKFREKSPINSLSKKNSFLNIKRESKIFKNNNFNNLSYLCSTIDDNNKSFLDDSEIDILTKKLNKITISNKFKKQNKFNNNNNKSLSLNESFTNNLSKNKLNPPILNNYISFRKAFDPNSNNNNKINDGKNNKNFISKNFEIKNKKINIVSFESIVNKSKQEKKLLDKEYLKKKKLYNMKIKKNKY